MSFGQWVLSAVVLSVGLVRLKGVENLLLGWVCVGLIPFSNRISGRLRLVVGRTLWCSWTRPFGLKSRTMMCVGLAKFLVIRALISRCATLAVTGALLTWAFACLN